MIVVNLFGAPGAGKSTGAAHIFTYLKQKGINAEIVTEFAKDKVWEDNKVALSDQNFIFGNQSFRLHRLKDKVDVAIVDSPLVMSAYYCNDNTKEEITALAKKTFNKYININYYVKRVKAYNPKGRLQTKEEADILAEDLHSWLIANGVDIHFEVNGDKAAYDKIAEHIYKHILTLHSI